MTHKFQISAKNTAGLIVVVGGDNVEEMYAGLQDFFGGSDEQAWAVLKAAQNALHPADAMQAAVQEVQHTLGATPVDAPARNFRQRPAQGAAIAVAPPISAVVCKHGIAAKLVPAGVSAKGAYGAFYACSLPRDAQCDFRANPAA